LNYFISERLTSELKYVTKSLHENSAFLALATKKGLTHRQDFSKTLIKCFKEWKNRLATTPIRQKCSFFATFLVRFISEFYKSTP
jgi:hypothetical protein